MLLALCPAHASDDKEQSFGMNIKNRQSRRKVAVGMLGMLTVFGIEVTATAAAPDLAHPFNIHPMHARGHAVVQIAPAFQKEEGYNVCPPEVIANLPVQVEWFHTLGEDLLELTTSHGAVLIYARRAKTSPSTPELVTLWEKGSPYLRSIYPSVVSGVDTFYALFMPSCLAFTRRDEHGKPSPPEVIDVINTTTGTTYRGLLRQGIDPGIPGAEPQKTVLELTMNRQGQIVYLAVLQTIDFLRMFDLVQNMTQGGPLNSTTTVVLEVYNEGFSSYNMGYAAALTVILFLVILLITVIQLRVLSRRVEY